MREASANARSLAVHTHPSPNLRPTGRRIFSAASRDVLAEIDESAIELENLADPVQEGSQPKTQRERRRAQKRERKLRHLREREEMKFSHSIQFNAVPDWSNHYISYSNLKKLYVQNPCSSSALYLDTRPNLQVVSSVNLWC